MKLSKYILFVLIYIAIQAIGMAVMYYGFGITYGSEEMTNVVLWVEIIVAGLVVFYVRRYASWRSVGYGRIRWVHMVWIAPSLILAVLGAADLLMGADLAALGTTALRGVLAVTLLTLLVGFSEETAFRGIVLRGALKRHNVFVSMFISAVAFALLHIVNVFGGFPLSDVPGDQFGQLMYGLFMAPLAILIGNLIPLILLHFLWDWIALASSYLATDPTVQPGPLAILNSLSVPVQFGMTVVVWVVVFVLWRRGTLLDD